MNHPLTVKAPEMDFPVEATVHLNNFQDEAEVRNILSSRGFKMTDLGGGQVRVKGSFLELKAVKAHLEPLVQSQTKTTPNSSSPASSGAIPKHYSNSNDRRRSQSRQKPLSPSSPTTSSSYASGPSHSRPTSQEYRASVPPGRPASLRQGEEFFVVDADVFRYADHLRKKDIENILNCHKVGMSVQEGGGSANITVMGKSASKAVGKLQSLLDDLSKSLRTQEVPRKDMNPEGHALLERIRKNRHIYRSVLVCETSDRLHLIGPSSESYELKQSLLGRLVDPSGRRGRTVDKSSRWRSLSLPPLNPRNTDRDSGARPSPAGAAGYSPSKDDEQEEAEQGAAALHGRGSSLRRRSQSESRVQRGAERANGYAQEKENQHLPPKSPIKRMPQLLNINLSFKNIKQKLKNRKK